ncbi:MAG: hypothetical protein ACREK5_06350 [Gemmatimonadota bacterium]
MTDVHGLARTFLRLCALATLALGPTACGGDEPPDLDEIASMSEDEVADMAREIKDLSGVKACELLTAAEIETATGLAPGAPEDISQVQGQLPMCNWPSADGSGRVVASILVTRGGFDNYEDFAETSREQLGADFNEEDWRHVPDVGDFGVWVGGGLGMLQVYEGERMVQVDAETTGGKDELEASKELAMKVFERL